MVFAIPTCGGIVLGIASRRSLDVALLFGLVLGAVVFVVYVTFFWK